MPFSHHLSERERETESLSGGVRVFLRPLLHHLSLSLRSLTLVIVTVVAAAAAGGGAGVVAERGRPAGAGATRHGRGQEGRLHLTRHYHQYLLFKSRLFLLLRLVVLVVLGLAGLNVSVSSLAVAFQVTREPPVGTRKDEKRESYEAQHRCQAPEEVRNRRMPRRPLRSRGRRRGHRRHGHRVASRARSFHFFPSWLFWEILSLSSFLFEIK
ncbi:hypothetical protein EUGRSUZ_C00195 [Eucalyptus grandis]|uniref:Uncharacterized protein n=2 Tax=Eucalyptus grandis TaxID=71139 RepID=A0A059CKI6_EUCGR|nr:hypothetical protein EUGRSUZ_C00195 [Eucalyptus grandis]